jgi:hypothetical protein
MSLRDAPLEDSTKRDTRSERITRLHGYRLVMVRLICLSLCVLSVGLFVASIPSYFANIHMLCTGTAVACNTHGQLAPGDVRRLQELGLSIDFFAIFTIVIMSIFACGYWLVAALLFWLKSDNPLALLAAVSLGTFPLAFGNVSNTLPPSWWSLSHVISFLGSFCIVLFFYVFPSGHFVPRWTRWVTVVALVYWVFDVFFPFSSFNPFSLSRVLNSVVFIGMIGGIIVVQIYRYRRVSSPAQRQQTKWVVYGVSMGVGGFLVLSTISLVFPPLFSTVSLVSLIAFAADYGLLLLVPLSIGLAILRSRLWDIDLIINRTLVYGALTTSLAFVYFGLIFALQYLEGIRSERLLMRHAADRLSVRWYIGVRHVTQGSILSETERTRRRFFGSRAYLAPKGNGDNSMLLKQDVAKAL